MPIALLILLSKSFTYIKTNNGSPLEPSVPQIGLF